MTNNSPSSRPVPPDQRERDRIVRELDRSLLVEAAAGTGKTTNLVARMKELLAEGKCQDIGQLAAVTFTRKAASELRARFTVALEKALRTETGARRDRLAAALGHVERCFIGTIHAFCGRLLRERPVEAGMDVGFAEMDEEEDGRLRQEAWDAFVAGLYAGRESPGKPHEFLTHLDRWGLEIGQLQEAFHRFAGYPDVEEWPATSVALPDLGPCRVAVRDFLDYLREFVPELWGRDPGNDKLIPQCLRIYRRLKHADLERDGELIRLLELFEGKKALVQKAWPGGKDQAKEVGRRYLAIREAYALPLLAAWRQQRYGPVLEILRQACQEYDRRRQEGGKLNYQDLLLGAARLLRDRPHVRRYFRGRFTHLLVDEFQDTDPVQAEVMLYLTADDPGEREWQRCRPVPGSLFVVGDPQQSIYRFRRADILTYQRVKEILRESGGDVVSLTANFRTAAPILDWVNGVFADRFPVAATEASPAYVKLEPGRGREKGAAPDASLVCLSLPAALGNTDALLPREASAIVGLIRQAVDRKEAVPGDFLIVARGRKHLGGFGAALRSAGIPYQVTGGSALNEAAGLSLLHRCLTAVVHPDDPVALVAALRGGLFGVADDLLYRFKRAGGKFTYLAPVPGSLDPETAALFTDIFNHLKRYAGWLRKYPPVPAIEKIAGDLGLLVLAAARPGGAVAAGSLAKALELLRAGQDRYWTAEETVCYLDRLVEQEEKYDDLPVRPFREAPVRVMNLHQVKGLEAPVVFLADPSGEWKPPVDLHVDRSGGKTRGYLAIYGEEKGPRLQRLLLAHPAGWQELAARESEFAEAEKLRLLYVAATRAGRRLVITQREKGNHRNPWSAFLEHLEGAQRVEAEEQATKDPDLAVETSDRLVPGEAEEAVQAIAEQWQKVVAPTYDATTVKIAAAAGQGGAHAGGVEQGTEWGTVIHLLLENALLDPKADLRTLGRASLLEQGIDLDREEEALETVAAVTRSAIWKRALTSPRRFVEVPFQVLKQPDLFTKTALPTILRGVIDLVFREKEGWVVVDYKTDESARWDTAPLVARYRGQLAWYAEEWTRLTGEKVTEQGLFFTRAGRYEKVTG